MTAVRDIAGYNPLRAALDTCRPHFVAIAIFSAVSNLLYLVPTLYMLQVYNRVVPTGGLATLAVLSLVMVFALGILAALEWVRGRLLVRASAQLEASLAPIVLAVAIERPDLSRLDRTSAMRNLETLRQTVASPGIVAILDAPWAPIYILAAALLHPVLGVLALAAAGLLLALTWHNERKVRGPLTESAAAAAAAGARQQHVVAYAAEVRALGMGSALVRRQLDERLVANRLQATAAFTSGNHAGLIKFLRLMLQSAALGVAAWLAVDGAVSAGAIFAASLLLSRALQPVEQVNAAWKSLLEARNAYADLTHLLDRAPATPRTRLPDPTGALAVERLSVLAPQSDRVALSDVSFGVPAGAIIGVVGASGSGKSSLLRAIAGAATRVHGTIRLDGAATDDWAPEELAPHIGYLPQNFVLFPGTIKENISRFQGLAAVDPDAIDAAAIAAAHAIGAHDMILRLPDGYDTWIGPGGIGLSAGQTQRIAIARALYGDPRILLLDEPSAHLDSEAQHAFQRTLAALRGRGATVLFATHDSDLLAATDRLLLLNHGRIEKFERLAEVISALRPVSHVASARN